MEPITVLAHSRNSTDIWGMNVCAGKGMRVGWWGQTDKSRPTVATCSFFAWKAEEIMRPVTMDFIFSSAQEERPHPMPSMWKHEETSGLENIVQWYVQRGGEWLLASTTSLKLGNLLAAADSISIALLWARSSQGRPPQWHWPPPFRYALCIF